MLIAAPSCPKYHEMMSVSYCLPNTQLSLHITVDKDALFNQPPGRKYKKCCNRMEWSVPDNRKQHRNTYSQSEKYDHAKTRHMLAYVPNIQCHIHEDRGRTKRSKIQHIRN